MQSLEEMNREGQERARIAAETEPTSELHRQQLIHQMFPYKFRPTGMPAPLKVGFDTASNSMAIFQLHGNFITTVETPEELWRVLQQEAKDLGSWEEQVTGKRRTPLIINRTPIKRERPKIPSLEELFAEEDNPNDLLQYAVREEPTD